MPGAVLLEVRTRHRVLQPLASRADRAHRDLAPADLDLAARLFEERPVPAARLDAPGAHEDSLLDDDHPDPDESMFRAGAEPQPLPSAKFVDGKRVGHRTYSGLTVPPRCENCGHRCRKSWRGSRVSSWRSPPPHRPRSCAR